METKSLEEKVGVYMVHSWKHWIPVYGVIKFFKDNYSVEADKKYNAGTKDLLLLEGWATYHAIATAGTLTLAALYLKEKLGF